jgi:hypothetical protein
MSRTLSSLLVRTGVAVSISVSCLLGAASIASAHDEYPGIILDTFPERGGCAPQCTLCHVNPAGGLPLKSEGISDYVGPHRGYGVFVGNLQSVPDGGPINDTTLPIKLRAMKTNPCNLGDTSDTGPCDSDGDGVTDYDEVSQGFDPDTPGEGNTGCPKYGCGATISPHPQRPTDAGRASLVIAALGVAFAVGRRARR